MAWYWWLLIVAWTGWAYYEYHKIEHYFDVRWGNRLSSSPCTFGGRLWRCSCCISSIHLSKIESEGKIIEQQSTYGGGHGCPRPACWL